MQEHKLKANSLKYQSVILPFKSKWYEPILNERVKVAFRKQGPSPQADIKWCYAYFSAPQSAICLKLEVTQANRRLSTDLVPYCVDGQIREEDLISSTNYDGTIFMYQFGRCIKPACSLHLSELIKRFEFKSTPGFTAISPVGSELLDEALGIK